MDFQAAGFEGDVRYAKELVRDIAGIAVDDGIVFDASQTDVETICKDHAYPGFWVSLIASLATARLHLHVDISIGDPILPPATEVVVPRLLGGELRLLSYPLVMIHAENIVTAISRGSASTRWRDFADVYLLSRQHATDGGALRKAIAAVAGYREVDLQDLSAVLDGYPAMAQRKWSAWRKKQRLEHEIPESFDTVVAAVAEFADSDLHGGVWMHMGPV